MTIYQQRPAFVVFGVDHFTSIPVAEVDFEQLWYPELKRVAGIGPMLADAKPPKDLKLRQDLLFGVVMGGQKDLEFRAELYKPYRPDLQQLRSRGIDLSKIAALSVEAKQAIDTFIASQGGRLEDYLYLPLKSKNTDIVMVLSSENGLPVGSIPISPWSEKSFRRDLQYLLRRRIRRIRRFPRQIIHRSISLPANSRCAGKAPSRLINRACRLMAVAIMNRSAGSRWCSGRFAAHTATCRSTGIQITSEPCNA